MKKFFILALIVTAFYGCENLKPSNNGMLVPIHKEQQLQQEDFVLNESGVTYILDIINTNVDNDKTRTFESGNTFEIYQGEYLSLPCEDSSVIVALARAPKIAKYDVFIRDGRFYFRSKYQGEYKFNLIKDGIIVKRISISNKAKYKISSRELENIIYRNYGNKKLRKMNESVELYRYMFPKDGNQLSISKFLFELAVIEGDDEVVRTTGKFLMENFNLSEKDKMKIMSGEKKVLGDDYSIYASNLDASKNSTVFNDFLARSIIEKSNPSLEEIVFLEEVYALNPSKELANVISNFYFKNGNVEKGVHYGSFKDGILPTGKSNISITDKKLSQNDGNNEEIDELQDKYQQAISYYQDGSYAEAIFILENMLKSNDEFDGKDDIPFYLGNSYMKSKNFNKAMENFKLIDKENKYYPESMYKLGEIYYKLGKKDEAIKRFEENKEIFAGTVWGRKSSIYLLKLQ